MYSVRIPCTIDDKDLRIAEMYERGTTGIVEDEQPGGDCTVEAFFDTAEEAEAAAAGYAGAALRDHGQQDYIAEFQRHWQPVELGRRIWLAPDWHPGPAPAGRVRIGYQPGMACGSGLHPCTQLCLEAIERLLPAGGALLDVGAGSGILLLAARALGAGRVAGCDIDHASARAAQALGLPVYTGSLRSVRGEAFDMAIANISSESAELLLRDLLRVVKPGGVVLVSGFRENDLPAIAGMVSWKDGWAAVTLSRRPAQAS